MMRDWLTGPVGDGLCPKGSEEPQVRLGSDGSSLEKAGVRGEDGCGLQWWARDSEGDRVKEAEGIDLSECLARGLRRRGGPGLGGRAPVGLGQAELGVPGGQDCSGKPSLASPALPSQLLSFTLLQLWFRDKNLSATSGLLPCL